MGNPNLISVGTTLHDLRRAVSKLASLRLNADSTPTFGGLVLSGIANEATDVDKFLVDSSGVIKYRTGAELLSDIGGLAGTHIHDGSTLQHDAVNSDGGAFGFNTTGDVTFNQSIIAPAAIPVTDDSDDLGLAEMSSPSYNLEIEQATWAGGGSGITPTIWFGQTFTPATTFDLGRVAMLIQKVSGGSGNITCYLRATTGDPALPTGGNLVTPIVIDGSSITTDSGGEWVIFELGTPYELTGSTIYSVSFSASESGMFELLYKGTDEYDGGIRVYSTDTGSNWNASAAADMAFRIYSYTTGEMEYTRWENLYLSGLLHDGTVSLSVANAKAAYTHISNDGTDHSYIDQDVSAAASPTFANLSLGTGELTAGSINRAADTLTLEIAGTPELSISTDLVAIANGLTVDTDTLVVNAVTHGVGFGTANPDTLVHLETSDTVDPAITFETTNTVHKIALFLDENPSSSILKAQGLTAAQDIAFHIQATAGKSALLKLSSGSSLVGTFFVNNSGVMLFTNSTDNQDIIFNGKRNAVANTEIMRLDVQNGRLGLDEAAPETQLEMTSTVPYLTLHNLTEENSDGGRESRINFKGEQDGTEETTLARIEVSHDGAADDEKGKFVISVNDGNDGNTPTDRFKIDAAGITHIGDGTNETQFSATGVQTMAGTARVMKSVNLEPSSAGENPGGAAFPDDDYIDDFFFHRFDPVSEESVTFHWEMPHDYAAGGIVHLHNEFVIENPPSSGGNLNVRIGVEYKKISLGEAFDFSAATATLYSDETIVESETPFIIHQDSGASFNTSGWVAGDVILMRLFREVGVDDTYDWDVTPSSDNDVWMFNHHLEYLCDKIGEAT